jgi:6-pyruvoyltetrahydropterin/6-carboxytetrahydropterin synthase
MDNKCACRHLHGHQGKIIINLVSDELTNGMVTDFKHLNWFKKFVDDVIDHKFLVDKDDPFLHNFILHRLAETNNKLLINSDEYPYQYINPAAYDKCADYEKEIYEGIVVVNFIPTAENFSKWIYNIVDDKMRPLGVKTKAIEFYETPKCKSVYINKDQHTCICTSHDTENDYPPMVNIPHNYNSGPSKIRQTFAEC